MIKILVIILLTFSTIYAVEDVSKTVADESQKKYERKAILTVDTVGFGSPSFNCCQFHESNVQCRCRIRSVV